jgi:uncharacterized protein (TIGR03067 family)
MRLRFLAVAAVGLLVGAGPVREEPRFVNRIPLVGVWNIVPDTLGGEKWSFRRDGTVAFYERIGVVFAAYQCALNTEPPRIDIGDGEVLMRGIYQLDGNRLKLCLGKPGQPRPKDFREHRGDKKTIVVLWRE